MSLWCCDCVLQLSRTLKQCMEMFIAWIASLFWDSCRLWRIHIPLPCVCATIGLIANQYSSPADCPPLPLFGCFGNSYLRGVRERKAARLSVPSCGNSRGSQGRSWGKTTQLWCNLWCLSLTKDRLQAGILHFTFHFSVSCSWLIQT